MTVYNAAVSGAPLLTDDGIPSQAVSGSFDVVVVNGGANDLGSGCVCGQCMEVVDAIVSVDGLTGVMPSLVQGLANTGAHVVLIGYYKPLAGSEYEGCELERNALNTRYSIISQSQPQVTFIDPSEVMTPSSTPQFYDEDLIHPSPAGSFAIGTLIADTIGEP